MKTIRVSRQTVARAIERANAASDDWQAELLELLLIPSLAKRWQELNPQFPQVAIVRHSGKPHKGYTRDDNLAVKDWTPFAGYLFQYDPEQHWNWNAVRTDWYSHSASTAWNGVRRDTICSWVEDIRMLALGYDDRSYHATLARTKIVLTSVADPVLS